MSLPLKKQWQRPELWLRIYTPSFEGKICIGKLQIVWFLDDIKDNERLVGKEFDWSGLISYT